MPASRPVSLLALLAAGDTTIGNGLSTTDPITLFEADGILDADFAGDYTTIPSGVLLLSTDDSTICSGLSTDDPVSLYENDATILVDSFSFPTNPGNAISIERVDIATGDVTTNWRASTCGTGSSPGQGTCP
jgi:hypothetical protein